MRATMPVRVKGRVSAKKNKDDARPPATPFAEEVARVCGASPECVKKVVAGLLTTVAKRLNENGQCRIPDIVVLRTKVVPARPAGSRDLFGLKNVRVKARPATTKITAAALKPLRA